MTALPEERALRFAIGASVTGAALKLGVGLWTGSLALTSSAADSLGDIMLSIVNLFVVRYADQSPDEEHNYGHGKAEGLGAMFEGGFIGAAGLFVAWEAVNSLVRGSEPVTSPLAIAVMFPVLALTGATVWNMRRVARQTGSLVLRADALHYESDVWMNLGVLGALIVTRLTGLSAVDGVVALGIAAWMLRASAQVVREGVDVLLDKSLPVEMVEAVQEIVRSSPGVLSFHDFRTRGGKIPHVDTHVVVAPETTAQALHDLHLHLLQRCQEVVGPNVRVMLHADPEGDDDHQGDDLGGVIDV
jgi:ferrous-iron efflux pump FieF